MYFLYSMKCIGITKPLILQFQYLAIFLSAQVMTDLQVKAMFQSIIAIEIKEKSFVSAFSFVANEENSYLDLAIFSQILQHILIL